ncbi:MAG TPA: HlyD family efflux transporter periplasmic adaptor subunit [Victivallales bacterium]|nr:HlyD family efflux transporter periplasmic adaptor subunit [Victivallales bacterium]
MKNKIIHFLIRNIRFVCPVFILIIGVLLYSAVTSGKTQVNNSKRIEEVKTLAGIPVNMKPVKMKIKAYGTVKPEKTVKVSSEVSGEVVYTMPGLRDGIVVKKGTVLAKINSRDYQIRLSRAETEIAMLKAQISRQEEKITVDKQLLKIKQISLQLEEKNYLRNKVLRDRNIVSPRKLEQIMLSLEKAKSEYLVALSELKSSRLELDYLNSDLKTGKLTREKAENELEKCIIKSPISGRLENVSVVTGEISPENSRLLSIIDDNSLEIPVSISMEEATSVLQFNPENSEDYTHWFKFDNQFSKVRIVWKNKLRKVEWWGKIIGINSFNVKTRTVELVVKPTIPVSAELDDFPLVSGLYCSVYISGREMKNAMEVPLNAIQLNNVVYTVGKAGRAMGHKVNILRYSSYQAVISSKGFKKGEYIIAQNLPDGLIDSTKVKIVKPLNSAI